MPSEKCLIVAGKSVQMQVIPLPEVNTNQKAIAFIILSIFQAEMLHLLRMHSLYWNDGCALCSDLVEFTLCLSHRHLSFFNFFFSPFQSSSPLLLSINVKFEHFKTETTHRCGAHWKQLSRNTLWFGKVLISMICRKHQRNW